MGILHPEFKYAVKRYKSLCERTKERLVGKHKRRKEKYARKIRKHLSQTIGATMVAVVLATGISTDTNADTQKTEKPNASLVVSEDKEESETNNFSPPTSRNPDCHDPEM